MNELIVLNYALNEVHIFLVSNEINVENYIENVLKFNLDECAWMLGKGLKVIKHRVIL